MTSADERGQLAMAVIEAAVAAMLIIAVIGAMTAMPRAQSIDWTSLDAHRTAVMQLCDGEHSGVEGEILSVVRSMDRPEMGMQVRIGREVFGPAAPAGPIGHAVALVPGCRLEVLVWAI